MTFLALFKALAIFLSFYEALLDLAELSYSFLYFSVSSENYLFKVEFL